MKIRTRNIILGLVIICLLILGYGIYQIYEIFYPNYFSSADFTDVSFENGQLPTKVEVLFSGFKNLENSSNGIDY